MINPMLHSYDELRALGGKVLSEEKLRNAMFVQELKEMGRGERARNRSRPIRLVARLRVALGR